MKTYTFDGHGINGADEYKSRLATLTNEGHAKNIGKLFAAAPELMEALEALLEHAEKYLRLGEVGGKEKRIIESARASIAKAKG